MHFVKVLIVLLRCFSFPDYFVFKFFVVDLDKIGIFDSWKGLGGCCCEDRS